MELNKYFFEALRLRLENILRALSNNRKAHIVYSTSIATDVKNTVYLQARDYIEPDVKPALAELLLFYKACVSHEGAHIRFTSLDDWKEACSRGPVFQNLTNIIEDGRIETAISQTLPGAGRWIKFTNQYVYNNRKPKTYGTGLQAFLMGLNVYSILQTVPPFLSPEIQRLIKLAAPYVDIGRAASSTKEVLECVEEILTIPEIKALVDASTPPPMIEGDKGTTSPEKTTPSKETSERAEKAKKIIQHRKSRNSDEEKSDHKKGSCQETEKEDDNVNNEDSNDNMENANSQKSSKNATGETEDTSDNTSDLEEALEGLDQGSEDDKEVSDSQDDKQDQENESDSQKQDNDVSDNNTDEETDDPSSNDETSESLDKNNDIENKDTPNPEEASENPDEDNDSNNEESSEQSLSSEESDDDLSEDSENEELDDSDNDFDDDASDDVSEEEFNQSDDDLSDNDFDSEDFEAELDSSVESYENTENNDLEFENGTPESHGNPGDPSDDEEEFFINPPEEDFGELLEDTNEEALTLTKEAENIEEENTPEDILEGIPANIHGGVELVPQNLRRNPSAYQALKKKNEVLIKNLVNEIQVALETRKAYDLRSLNRGRLHSGSLWKLAVPDPTVFSRRVIPGDMPELAVYILVDLSGSMSEQNTYPGPTRIQSVKNATCVLSEAMRELKIIHAVTGFNSFHPITYHYPAVTWEDTDSVKIASFRSTNSNRDGFSIRVAANELSYRQEPKKILFVLSDGQPADCGGYVHNLAWSDVKQAIFEAKQKGIKVISLFFGEESLVSTFKFMYDTPVFVPDLTVLPRALGEVFKRVYLE